MAQLGNRDVRSTTEKLVKITYCLNEGLKKIISTQQGMWNYSLHIWQTYNQQTLDCWLNLIEHPFDQALTTREQMSRLLEDQLRKIQELTIIREEKFFEAAETLQSSILSDSEYIAKLFASSINNR